MGNYVVFMLALTAEPAARITVGESQVYSFTVANMANSSNQVGCDETFTVAEAPNWKYSFSPGLRVLSVNETYYNGTTTLNYFTDNITQSETAFNYTSSFPIAPYRETRLDLEVVVEPPNQNTIDHLMVIEEGAASCSGTESVMNVTWTQVVCASGGDCASSASSLATPGIWSSLGNLLFAHRE